MFDHNSVTFEAAAGRPWDCIIAGGGMGGAAAAYELCRQGMNVLIIEKGKAVFTDDQSVTQETNDIEQRYAGGRWPTRMTGDINGQTRHFWAPLGAGLGGSTTLYAAALHRLRPVDFDPQLHPAGGTVDWPFSYADIAPYYAQVEQLFAVHGTPDPLEPDAALLQPPPLPACDRDMALHDAFQSAGLHPYRLHSGIGYASGCRECLGNYCARRCKRDAANSLLAPAFHTGRLSVCCDTEVLRLEMTEDGTQAKGLVVRQGGQDRVVSGRTVILAAGGYISPVLMLRSTSEAWPMGVGNQSGLLGRNLMFHVSEQIAVWPRGQHATDGPRKTLALRDFYEHDGQKYGELQSAGLSANYGNILYSLRLMLDLSPFSRIPGLRQVLRQGARIPAWVAAKALGEAAVFATIVEDFPYPENRVLDAPDAPSGIRFEYRLHDELQARSRRFIQLIRDKLKQGGVRSLPLSHSAQLNFGHPCGTCKAGHDAKTSVLDGQCRAHGVENLYVLDSSFMPTSGGTNPSLTIAANALRVSARIAASFHEVQHKT